MNVDSAAGNSHSLQSPDVFVPLLLENTVRAVSLWRLLHPKTYWRPTGPFLTYAVAHARFQHGDDEAGESDVARQDDTGAHDLARSATVSDF